MKKSATIGVAAAVVLALPTAGVLSANAASSSGSMNVAGATSPSASTFPVCHTADLRVWRGAPADHAAGSAFYELEFSNVSSHTCTLTGYPRVRAVGSGGQVLGSGSAHDTRFAPKTVVLRPRTTAHALLQITDVGVFTPSSCDPTKAVALKVFPPQRTRAAKVPLRFMACSTSGPVYLHVRVVRPRAGIPGFSQ